MITILAEAASNVPPELVYGGGSAAVGTVLTYVAMRIGKLANKVTQLVDAEIERRKGEAERLKAEADHRELQQHHWMVEERLMRQMAGIPEPDTGSHTPIRGIPLARGQQ
jgi:hypothetical protein